MNLLKTMKPEENECLKEENQKLKASADTALKKAEESESKCKRRIKEADEKMEAAKTLKLNQEKIINQKADEMFSARTRELDSEFGALRRELENDYKENEVRQKRTMVGMAFFTAVLTVFCMLTKAAIMEDIVSLYTFMSGIIKSTCIQADSMPAQILCVVCITAALLAAMILASFLLLSLVYKITNDSATAVFIEAEAVTLIAFSDMIKEICSVNLFLLAVIILILYFVVRGIVTFCLHSH